MWTYVKTHFKLEHDSLKSDIFTLQMCALDLMQAPTLMHASPYACVFFRCASSSMHASIVCMRLNLMHALELEWTHALDMHSTLVYARVIFMHASEQSRCVP